MNFFNQKSLTAGSPKPPFKEKIPPPLSSALPLRPPVGQAVPVSKASLGAALVLAEYKAVRASIKKIRQRHREIRQALTRLEQDKEWWK